MQKEERIQEFNSLRLTDKLALMQLPIANFLFCIHGNAYAFDIYSLNSEIVCVTYYKRLDEIVAVDMVPYAKLDNIILTINLPEAWTVNRR